MLSARRGLANGKNSFAWRLASAVIGLPLLLLIIWLGAWWLNTLVAIATALAVLEYYRLLRNTGLRLLRIPGLILAVAGPLYLGVTLRYAILLRQLDDGAQWLVLALFTTFATDSGAYLVGRAIGRHPLVPRISPGKTWEGGAAGLVAGTGASPLLTGLFGLPLALWEATLMGFGVGIVAQLGDLLESALKRYTGAKEAGSLIPGHGGLLDRLDSVVLNLVLVYYVAIWVAT